MTSVIHGILLSIITNIPDVNVETITWRLKIQGPLDLEYTPESKRIPLNVQDFLWYKNFVTPYGNRDLG